ncbi:hypothetical protein [Methanoregula sp.]|uniref:hypothetical protein n=1 Tax=Methanoregula sp. TaxID=2052170 RepID=UPI00236E9983|nr:hypothetical protein [Methanoregula sp.]MDD1686837.1 hypothetical protein [Methanoregula sp.]
MTELSVDLGTEMKKVEAERRKADVDHQIRELEQDMNKTGHAVSEEIRKTPQ